MFETASLSGFLIAIDLGMISAKIKITNVMTTEAISGAYCSIPAYPERHFIAKTVAIDEAKMLTALFPNNVREMMFSRFLSNFNNIEARLLPSAFSLCILLIELAVKLVSEREKNAEIKIRNSIKIKSNKGPEFIN